ncbi:MAG: universal stress protein [Alphaproteobacteria bacterium]
MALKNILVYISDSAQSQHRVDAAIDLAMRHDAHLTGIDVEPTVRMSTYVAPEIPKDVLREIQAQHAARAAKARANFETAAQRTGWFDRCSLMTEHGDPIDVLSLHARHADLTIVGQTPPPNTPNGEMSLAHDLVLQSGRPVLVMPFFGATAPIGKNIVVAWNGGREAARAVGDAMSLLERADTVCVLSIQPEGSDDAPGADITHHLARHGVRATARQSVANNVDTGDVLLNFVADSGADLLVMGAYGHSRMREMVLGGVTRHVLQHAAVPILMSH